MLLALLEPTFLNLFWQIPDGAAIARGHFPRRVETAIESGPLIAQEWLFELAAGVLATHGLFALVVLGCAAAAAATPLLIYALARRAGCAALPAGIVAFLSLGARFAASTERAETFAVDLFALELLALGGALPLWTMAPIVVLWANLHASVLLAVVAPAIVAFGALVAGRARDAVFRRALAACGIAAASTLATPYGTGLWAYAWNLAVAANPAKEQLPAWQPLSFASAGTLTTVLPGLTILVALGVVARRRTVPELLLAASVVVATLAHARMASFLVVAWAVPLARALDERTALRALSLRYPRAPILGLLPLGALVVLVPHGMHATPERAGPWQAAAAIARDHGLRGNLYTPYDWAAYLTYRGLPLRPLIDAHGDPYPPAVWRDAATLQHVAPGWTDVLERRKVRVVLVAADAPLAEALAARRDWRRVERRDGVDAFLRR